MSARKTAEIKHGLDRERNAQSQRRARARLTPSLVADITKTIRTGASLGAALVAVRDSLWHDKAVWLNISSVYRWLQLARSGRGGIPERCLLAAVTVAEADRGPVAPRLYTTSTRVRIETLERRVADLEERLAALTSPPRSH